VKIIEEMLDTLKTAYGRPIDTEFTAFVNSKGRVRINLLQCRPMSIPGSEGRSVDMPKDIAAERILFQSNRIVCGGVIPDIRYIVFIHPKVYNDLPMEIKKSIGRVVGRINALPCIQEGKNIMMGPGRWGTSNIVQGVNAHYSDINNAAILVEVAKEDAGQVPDVSYGTHFFLDLVESQIIYLPVYPDDAKCRFNWDFFNNSPNVLAQLLPDAAEYEKLIHIIDVPHASKGLSLQAVADPQNQNAICYLK